jgi:hypothetical protein
MDAMIIHALEAAMLVCFGVSWPFSIAKTVRMRSGGSKSYVFFCFILLGYLCGIAKELMHPKSRVLYFYLADALLITADLLLCLYFNWCNGGESAKITATTAK